MILYFFFVFFLFIFFNWEGGFLYFLLLLISLFTLIRESSILRIVIVLFFNFLCSGILYFRRWLLFFFYYEILRYILIFYLLVGGSQSEKVLSSYFFLIYRFASSFLFLFCILFRRAELDEVIFLFSSEMSCFFFFFFCVKIPIYFFHRWLPKVHVESSTLGSVCLAALILKMAFLGLILSLYLCSRAVQLLLIFILLLSLFLSSFRVISQVDGKRFVAFSSVVHIRFFRFLLLRLSGWGLISRMWGGYSHGAVSGILFFIIGSILMSSGGRLLYTHSNFGGIIFFVFFIFWFFNRGLPLRVGFLSELFGVSVIFFLNMGWFFFIFFYFFLTIFTSILYGLTSLVGSWSGYCFMYLLEVIFFLFFFILGIFLIV